MRRRVLGIAVICLTLGWANTAQADEWGLDSVGVFGGPSFGGDESFTQVDLVANVATPWAWESDSGFRFSVQLQGTAGALWAASKTAFVGAFGPVFKFEKSGLPAWAEISSRPTVISSSEFDDDDLGGAFQFTSHAAFGVAFGNEGRFRVGYRIQHMSNAGIYSENDGVNIHGAILSYGF